MNSEGQINVSSWNNIIDVAAGGEFTVGLKSDGTVLAVGNNYDGQLNVDSWTGILQVAVGDSFTVGLKSDGTVIGVGVSSDGGIDVGAWSGIVQIAAGYNFTVGRKSDGTVMASGGGAYGTRQELVNSWSDIIQVAAGDYTVGRKSDGTVVAVGPISNDYGQLDIESWQNIVWIAAGSEATYGVKSDGTVIAIGGNRIYSQTNLFDWNLGVGTGYQSDTLPPTINSSIPDNGSIDVAVNQAITVNFSDAMAAPTINSATFTLTDGVNNISGTISYSGKTAKFTPTSDLVLNTTFTGTMTTGAKDLAGNPLQETYNWSFTSGSTRDTTSPSVSSSYPSNTATGIAVESAISVTFSEAMDPSTIKTTSFTLNNGITGSVIYDPTSRVATFTPGANLDYDTTYTGTITTGVKDLAANPLQVDYVWSFSTQSQGTGDGGTTTTGSTSAEVKQLHCFISCAGNGLGMTNSPLWLPIVIGCLLIKGSFPRKNKKKSEFPSTDTGALDN